jgi:uncharacterized protein
LTITPEFEESFILRLRIPGWSKKTEVKINGQAQQNPIQQGTYLSLNRLWRPIDEIDIMLDISPRFWLGEPPPGISKGEGSAVSVYLGPLLLAYDPRFDIHGADQLPFIATRKEGKELKTICKMNQLNLHLRPIQRT